MLENVYRHLEMGKSRMRAAFDGAKEIAFAILATTITLVAVFIPVAFLAGRIGKLFNEFGIAVAVSVLISGFVALTLTPMLCSRVLRRHEFGSAEEAVAHRGHGAPPEEATAAKMSRFDRFFQAVHERYDRLLRKAVAHRAIVMGATAVLIALIGVLYVMLPKELVPTEDRGLIFNLVMAPEGSTLEYTDRYVRQAEAVFKQVPEVQGMFTAVGLGFGAPGRVSDGFMFVRLKPYGERKRSQQQIVQQAFPQMMAIPGVLSIPINPPSLGGGFGRPVQFVIQAESYDELQRSMGVMLQEAQKLGYLLNMDSDLELNKPQLEIQIDRDRAAERGVSVAEIGGTLQTLLGGREVTNFKLGSKQYDVILQVPPRDRSSPSVIEGLYVRGREGVVQLANVVKVKETVSPRELNHFNRVRSATLAANLAPGVTLGRAIPDLQAIARRALPAGTRTDLAGESREFAESSGGLNFLFLISLVFIYLVLAAQFESFVHPLTILFSVPLAVFGALLSLFMFKMSINIYSQIGLIMLIGLVTKNGILIVEYANQRRRGAGGNPPEPLVEAVVSASRIRLRPILMTALATVFGVLPIALGLGAGAESRKPLGVAVVGGMLFSTVFTLVIVPVVYPLLARFAGDPARAEAAAAEAQSGLAAAPEAAHSS
jgi:multidrug efflux pump